MKRFFIISALLLPCLFSFAQEKSQPFGFHFKGKHQRFAKIPFEVHASLIVLKIRIDSSDTLRFILDTGVSANIITNVKTAEKLQFKTVRKVKITGAGEEESLNAAVSVNHTMKIGDVIAENQNIVILEKDILQLSEYLGLRIDGIFGHELFDAFVVQIDFDEKELSLTLPQYFKYKPKRHGTRFDMIVTQSKPYIDAFTFVDKEKESPMRLLIDTGAGHALLLGLVGDIRLPEKTIRANLGKGLSGDLNGYIGRVQKIKLGNLELNNLIASFPDSVSFSTKFSPSVQDRQGSIGCELLRRFVTILNYHDGYMAFYPVKKKINDPFEHDMSGLEIKAKGENFKEYIVDKVLDNSPAFAAGIQKGDEIVFINNLNAKDMTITEVYEILSRKEGKKIELFIRRDGQMSFAKFELKRTI